MQTVDWLQALCAKLLPGQAKRVITTGQTKAMLATVRPRDIAGKTRRRIAAEELIELIAVEVKIKKATGTAPLDASSGEQDRHRLSRAGNRRMNHMIHIAAVTQIRLETDSRINYQRKRSEATPRTRRSDARPAGSVAEGHPQQNLATTG